MIALISSILGILSAIVPSLIRLFEKRMEYQYETRLFELKLEAAVKGLEFTQTMEDIRSVVAEGDSLRQHDLLLGGDSWMDILRVSIRPVITYLLFGLFFFSKLIVLFVMLSAGTNIPDVMKTIFDDHTIALLSSIMGFWFGSRSITKMEELYSNMNTSKATSGTFKVKK